MNRPIVKISRILIKNFKNIKNGDIDLSVKDPQALSLIGLYGQNGSGKTALIDALLILKHLLCGMSIPKEYCNYINIDSDSSSFVFDFLVQLQDGNNAKVSYSFSIKKEEINNSNLFLKTKDNQILLDNNGEYLKTPTHSQSHKIIVFDESISFSIEENGIWRRKRDLISTKNTDTFIPKNRLEILVGNNAENTVDVLIARKICYSASKSFVFSSELLNLIKTNSKTMNDSSLKQQLISIMNSLIVFGNQELFIINTSNHALISLNALPVSFRMDSKKQINQGSMALPLNKSITMPQNSISLVERIISNLNTVLQAIIPGLTIGIKTISTELLKSGETGKTIELISNKNHKEIPLKYESEGIKKIISILQLLIIVYNQPSITVAIDELDSGIFEYLLGELLHIISEKGKGQLIFTSHNLRPLETLDKRMIYFTTTNQNNRYIKMSYLKPNNNLRDFYYRSILLGGQTELLYQPTDDFKISIAFRKAGKND